MAHQATMNGHGTSPASKVQRNVAGLAHDVLELSELQVQLLMLDLQEMKARAVRGGLMLGVGVVLALAALPVLLIGAGWALVEAFEWSAGASIAGVAGLALVIACGVALAGVQAFRGIGSVMDRSKKQLQRNVQAVKAALQRDGD